MLSEATHLASLQAKLTRAQALVGPGVDMPLLACIEWMGTKACTLYRNTSMMA